MSMRIIECMSVFGTFPYIRMQNSEQIVYRSSNYLIFFTVLNIIIQIYSGMNLLKLYRVQTSMPQILAHICAYFAILLIFIIRLKKREETQKFLNTLLSSCTCESYGPNVVMFWVQFALGVVHMICVYITFELLPVKIIEYANFNIALSFWAMMAASSIDYQMTCICGILEVSFRVLNTELSTATLTHHKLSKLKHLHCSFVCMTRDCNRIYGLELFLAFSCSSLITFVTINDLIYYITLPYFEDFNLYMPLRVISTVVYVLKLITTALRPCWLCYRASALIKEASKTTSVLCNRDLQTLDTLTQDTFLLFLEQAVHREVEVSAFGVCSLNTSLIFTGIGLAATFVVLFIQWSYYNYKP